MLMCTGMADSVDFVNATRPAVVSNPAFHVGIRAAITSTSGCSSVRCSRRSDGGMPRYFDRNGATVNGNACRTASMVASSQQMGVATHFSLLVMRPEASAKSCSIWERHCISPTSGANRMMRSSA